MIEAESKSRERIRYEVEQLFEYHQTLYFSKEHPTLPANWEIVQQDPVKLIAVNQSLGVSAKIYDYYNDHPEFVGLLWDDYQKLGIALKKLEEEQWHPVLSLLMPTDHTSHALIFPFLKIVHSERNHSDEVSFFLFLIKNKFDELNQETSLGLAGFLDELTLADGTIIYTDPFNDIPD